MEFNLKSKVGECGKLINVVDGLDETLGKQMNERSLTESRKSDQFTSKNEYMRMPIFPHGGKLKQVVSIQSTNRNTSSKVSGIERNTKI